MGETVWVLAYNDGETFSIRGVYSTEAGAYAARVADDDCAWLDVKEHEVN